MGYNVSNRRMRSSMFSKRATKQGSKAVGDVITGLLGAGVVVGKAVGAAIEEGARNAQIEQAPKPEKVKSQKDANVKEQKKKKSVAEWVGIILLILCGAALLAVVLYYLSYLAFGLLLILGLLSKR